jgi:hypothetical protein
LLQELEADFLAFYDRSVRLWTAMYQAFKGMISAVSSLELPARDIKRLRFSMGVFWSAHQRYFRQLVLAAKVCGHEILFILI